MTDQEQSTLLTQLATDIRWIRETTDKALSENKDEHKTILGKLEIIQTCYDTQAISIENLQGKAKTNRQMITGLIGAVVAVIVGVLVDVLRLKI